MPITVPLRIMYSPFFPDLLRWGHILSVLDVSELAPASPQRICSCSFGATSTPRPNRALLNTVDVWDDCDECVASVTSFTRQCLVPAGGCAKAASAI